MKIPTVFILAVRDLCTWPAGCFGEAEKSRAVLLPHLLYIPAAQSRSVSTLLADPVDGG